MNQKRYYFDYAATTPVDQRVVSAMEPYWYRDYGNPSSLHREGRKAKDALAKCREEVAGYINSGPDELVFTSGGTESNNLALMGVAMASARGGVVGNMIISAIEHKSVLRVAEFLKIMGWQINICPVGQDGLLQLDKLEKMVDDQTVLASVIYANNEIGVVQDLPSISRIIKSKNPSTYIHTDACQALNYSDCDVKALGVDLMTFNGSKIYGPKGVAGLFIKKGVEIKPYIYGGGQEGGLRPGTENIPLIVGLKEAVKIAGRIRNAEVKRLLVLRDKIISRILKNVPDVILNGDKSNRLPNNIHMSFVGVEGESLVLYLDEEGIAVSTGSACSASDLDPSHVLMAIGQDRGLAHGSLRITLGRWTSEEGVEYLLRILPEVVERVRKMSAV